MEFVWVFFIWVIIMIILAVRAIWKDKKKKEMFISKETMRKYDSPMTMSIEEILARKKRMKND